MFQFLNMGGYGFYVWPAYGVTMISFLMYGVSLIQSHKRTCRYLKQNMQTHEY